MGKKYYETEEFLRLSREWEQKLESDGFEPLSAFESGTTINPQKFTVTDEEEIGGSNYSKLCQTIMQEYNFVRDVDYLIFDLHTQGKTIRFIEEYLKNNDHRHIKRSQVADIIKRVKDDYVRGKK